MRLVGSPQPRQQIAARAVEPSRRAKGKHPPVPAGLPPAARKQKGRSEGCSDAPAELRLSAAAPTASDGRARQRRQAGPRPACPCCQRQLVVRRPPRQRAAARRRVERKGEVATASGRGRCLSACIAVQTRKQRQGGRASWGKRRSWGRSRLTQHTARGRDGATTPLLLPCPSTALLSGLMCLVGSPQPCQQIAARAVEPSRRA